MKKDIVIICLCLIIIITCFWYAIYKTQTNVNPQVLLLERKCAQLADHEVSILHPDKSIKNDVWFNQYFVCMEAGNFGT